MLQKQIDMLKMDLAVKESAMNKEIVDHAEMVKGKKEELSIIKRTIKTLELSAEKIKAIGMPQDLASEEEEETVVLEDDGLSA